MYKSFSRFERLRSGEINAQFDLKKALSPIFDDFDVILIDCPPSLGLITLNAFSLSDFVLVPIEAHLFSMDGLDHMCNMGNHANQSITDAQPALSHRL